MQTKTGKRQSWLYVLKREFGIIRQRKKSYLYLLILIEILSAGLLPFFTVLIPKSIINSITSNADSGAVLVRMPFLFGFLLVLSVISLVCNRIFDGDFVELRHAELLDLHERYQEVEYCCLEEPEFADRAKGARRALSGPTGFEGVYRNFIKLCTCSLTILVYVVCMCRFQPVLALACILGTCLSIYINGRIADYIGERKNELSETERQKEYFENMSYDFSYGKDIRIFSLAGRLNQEYRKKSGAYINVFSGITGREFELGLWELGSILLRDGISFFLIVRGYYSGALDLGDVTLFAGMLLSLSSILETAVETFKNWIKCLTYSSMYLAFMEDTSMIRTGGTRRAVSEDETLKIEFRDVSFRYPGSERWILRHFNLTIDKGERLAIVGINGAGKSTIIKLLTGLFPVTEGEILVNGINIQEYDAREYAKMFSAVYQEIKVYAASFIENVAGVEHDADARGRAVRCLEAVGLKEKIESLPQGYDTPLLKVIEDGGTDLSGGQSQKLAIARALYKDANMIILDEPTASLDALAESEIYRSFNELVGNKTAVYISHRLSSTTFCDKIMLFSPEGILEYGNHESLMALKGEYYHMFETQGQYYREGIRNE